jgi:type IV pilus assembly protein PilM
MAGLFSNLFKKKEQSIIGVDIGSSAIKVVQLRRSRGKAVLETYGALALGPYAGVQVGKATNLPVNKLVQALSDILKEAKVSTKSGGIAIPFSSSLMTVIELPLLDEKQLAQMIPLEARKYIPVPITEVKLDWTVMPRDQFKEGEGPIPEEEKKEVKKEKVEQTDVLLVAIHNDTIRNYQEIIQKTELGLDFFEIEIFSTMRSVLDDNTKPVMVFDMGAASTKMYIVDRGAVRSSHTVNRGSQDITGAISTSLGIPIDQAEIMKRTIGYSTQPQHHDLANAISLTLDHVFSEAKQVLLNFGTKYHKTVEKVYLVGGGSTMKDFDVLAERGLGVQVLLGDPFAKVEAPAFLNDLLRKNGPEFAVALGIALRKLQE